MIEKKINKTNIGSSQRLVKLIARLIKERKYHYQNDLGQAVKSLPTIIENHFTTWSPPFSKL